MTFYGFIEAVETIIFSSILMIDFMHLDRYTIGRRMVLFLFTTCKYIHLINISYVIQNLTSKMIHSVFYNL